MTRSTTLVLALALASKHAVAQAPINAERTKANELFNAQDWTNASRAYRTLTQRYPNDGQLWLRLGVAYRSLGKLDSAAVALDRSITSGLTVPTPHVELARVRAREGKTKAALEHLEHAVTAGLGAPRILTDQPDFESLRGESQFRALVTRLTATRFPCRDDSTFHQFDFWLGTWEVRVGGGVAGTNDITRLLEQCLVLENWTDRFGGQGKSMNFYDATKRQWRQVWVADNGSVLEYAGTFREGAMRFEGVTVAPNGTKTLQKLTFFPIARDTVRQLFENSTDNGATWTPGFDGIYVRKAKP